MQAFKSIQEAKKELKKVKSCATGTDRFIAQCFPLLFEVLSNGKKPKSKKLSAWNQFVGKGLKAGKSMKQIGQEWQDYKATP